MSLSLTLSLVAALSSARPSRLCRTARAEPGSVSDTDDRSHPERGLHGKGTTMLKLVLAGAICLCMAVTMAGCGTGLLADQPTPTLVPLPKTTSVAPTPALAEAVAAPSVTPTAAEEASDMAGPASPTPTRTSEPTAAPPAARPMAEPTSSLAAVPAVETTPVRAATSTPAPLQAVVQADRLNVRTGPGTAYPRLGQLGEGREVEIVGRDGEGTWWQIIHSVGVDGLAWVSADYIDTDIGAGDVPVVEVAPPPAPAPVEESTGFNGKIAFQESSGGRIFTVNADGSGLTYLTNGLDPDWSPDGSQILFTRWEWDPPSVFVINADGTGEREIVPGPKAKGPQWSPDGSHIVFTSERRESAGRFCFQPPFGGPAMCITLPKENHWKISVLDLATGHIMDPATDPFSFAPSWSPDGRRLVYDGVRGLRPADPIEGHDQEAAYIDYDHRDMYPVWSPTSDRIAFMFRQHDHWEIYAVNADGSGRARLTESPLFEPSRNSVAPEWSPDGQWIAFLTDRRGKWEVWMMRPDGSEEQPMFPPGALEGIEFQYYEQSEHVLDWWMPPPGTAS